MVFKTTWLLKEVEIVSKSEDSIKYPRTFKDMDQAKAYWASKFRISTVIGAKNRKQIKSQQEMMGSLCGATSIYWPLL